MKKINATFSIETLSPVSITSGTMLSPLTDYIIAGNKLVYADPHLIQQRMGERLSDDPQIIGDYMKQVQAGMTASRTRTEARLDEFLEKRLGLTPDDFPECYPVSGTFKESDKLQIRQIVRNGKQAYIPGSTLKGAIKGAILYDRLSSGTGRKYLENLIVLLDDNVRQHAHLIAERDSWLTAQNGTLDIEQKKQLKPLFDAVKIFLNEFQKIENQLLVYESPRVRAPFSGLLCGDSNPAPSDTLEIRHIKRLNLRRGSFDIPQLCEAIRSGAKLTCRVEIIPEYLQKHYPEVNSEGEAWLLRCLRTFSLQALEFDLRQESNRQPKDPHPAHTAYLNTVSALKHQLEEGKILTRLGSGKSFLFNSIGVAIGRYSDKAFENLLILLPLGEPDQKQFPLTRILTESDYQPLGWVSINT